SGSDCSMQACNMPSNSAVDTALFVLVAPASISYRSIEEPAPLLEPLFFAPPLSIPSIPPPRALPN
ncbi:MAG: hypothetical protein ACRD4Y_11880, partial [Candidatus Acidiferrales bacterium]